MERSDLYQYVGDAFWDALLAHPEPEPLPVFRHDLRGVTTGRYTTLVFFPDHGVVCWRHYGRLAYSEIVFMARRQLCEPTARVGFHVTMELNDDDDDDEERCPNG